MSLPILYGIKSKLKNSVIDLQIVLRVHFFKRFKEPDFLIIGAQKAGTTAIFNYVSKHPQVEIPLKKEIHYFDLNFYKSKKWYLAHFPSKLSQEKLTGEATPYYLFHPFVAERVAKLFPNIKLIVILRNPVDRAFSHYQMEKRNFRETATNFSEGLELEKERKKKVNILKLKNPKYQDKIHQNFLYAERGLYSIQIANWLQYFPSNNFHFIFYDEFFSNPDFHFKKICSFLGISEKRIENYKVFNKGDYNRKIDKDIIENYFPKIDTEKKVLEKLLNRKINWDD